MFFHLFHRRKLLLIVTLKYNIESFILLFAIAFKSEKDQHIKLEEWMCNTAKKQDRYKNWRKEIKNGNFANAS